MTTARTALAARIRAAREYSDIKQPALAGTLGISVTTLSRMENGKTDVDLTVAYEIADACEVPRWFIDHGFDVTVRTDEPELAEVVEALAYRLATLEPVRGDVERLTAQMEMIIGLAEDRTADALGRAGRRREPPGSGEADLGTGRPD